MAHTARTVRRVAWTVASLLVLSAIAAGRPALAATQMQFANGATFQPLVQWVPQPPTLDTRVLGAPDDLCAAAGSQPGGAWVQVSFPAFSIPAGQKIDGVEAKVKYLSAFANPVQLTNGGVLVGTVRMVPAHIGVSACTGTGWATAGGPTDKWGLALTPADFNAGNIGFRITQAAITTGGGDPGGATLDIDAVELVVHFSPINSPPTAEAGGPYTVAEGGSVGLSGAGSSDPDQSAASLDYDWDLDNNGTFETANTQNPTFSAVGLDGPTSRTVVLRVTDNGALTDTDTATVNVVNAPPSLTVNSGSVTVNEGATATNSGTFSDPGGDVVTITASVGSVTKGAGTWSWSFITSDGPDDSQTVTITATDDDGASITKTFALVVLNVPPTIQSVVNGGPIDEGGSASVTVSATDPGGSQDPLTYAFDCNNDGSFEVGPQSGNGAACPFGDDGAFVVGVRVADDDGGVATGATVVTVLNVAPMAVLSTAGAIPFPDGDAFVGRKGIEQAHDAQADDPGSDDLTFHWDFEGSVATTTYFNDTGGPTGTPDPALSPGGTFPFTASDTAAVTFSAPGVYTVTIEVTDDDGGSASDSLPKLVTDDSECARSQGFWRRAYRGDEQHHDTATLEAYLGLVNFASAVFSESVPAATVAEADAVFEPKKDPGPSMRAKATQQALAAWLNFASGAVGLDEAIDSDGDGVPDTPFHVLMQAVEAILLNPGATHADLVQAKGWAEAVNLHDAGDPDCAGGAARGGDRGRAPEIATPGRGRRVPLTAGWS